ncbi:transglutaminase TgpA family protein [Pseudomonas sp. Marseille-QA0892]
MSRYGLNATIPRTSLTWLLVAQFLVILPHLAYLPLWVSLLWVGCAIWRIQMYRMRARYPNGWIKAFLMGGTIAGVYLSRGGLVGLDAAVVLLISAFVLKLVEMKSRRDALVVIYLGFFAVLTRYLFDSEIATAAISLLPTIALLSALVGLQHSGFSGRIKGPLKLSLTLLAQAVPLMLVLFLFFPRLGPLWSLPQPSNKGVTGLSDSMAPGEIAELSQSGELAFRANFETPPPHRSKLYWRALTLDQFDGRRWSRTPSDMASPPPVWEREGLAIHYNVIMERSAKPWLFVLDVAAPESSDGRLFEDFRVEHPRPVDRTLLYRMTSWPSGVMEPDQASRAVVRSTHLPTEGEPRARSWASQLRAQYSDDNALVDAVLRHFREQPYVYTLRPPVLERNAIDGFLFDTRRGFCEHYAGATAFVLRAAGIPARVVVGYQGGEFNQAAGYVQVRQFDAHAWVEFWTDASGWKRIDPTFQVAPERIERGLEDAVANERSFLENTPFSPLHYRHLGWMNTLRMEWDAVNYGWQRWVLGYQAEQQNHFLQRLTGERDTLTLIIVAAAGLALMFAGLCIVVLKPWRRRLPAEQRAFESYERMLRRHGVVRLASEGPRTFADRAARELPAAAAPIRLFALAYEQRHYNDPQAQGEPESLITLLKEMRRALGGRR